MLMYFLHIPQIIFHLPMREMLLTCFWHNGKNQCLSVGFNSWYFGFSSWTTACYLVKFMGKKVTAKVTGKKKSSLKVPVLYTEKPTIHRVTSNIEHSALMHWGQALKRLISETICPPNLETLKLVCNTETLNREVGETCLGRKMRAP